MSYKNDKRFCEITRWWNIDIMKEQVSPHFFLYPAELMLKKGFDVEVISRLYQERNERDLEFNDGIKIRRFPKKIGKFFPSLARHMLKNEYSLIHLHTISFVEDYVPWFISRLKKTPMVFTSHSPELPSLEIRKDIKAKIFKKSLKIMNSESSIFIAFTKFQADLYKSFDIENIKIIPHGIDSTVFDVDKDYKAAEKYGLGENNILCVGQIDPRKGQHILVKSMTEILKHQQKTKLILVGRCSKPFQKDYSKMLKSLIEKLNLKNNVMILNDASKDELIQLYLLSDIFAFPTDRELSALVYLEAMAAGLPIISTDRPYIREILQNGDAGLLVKREQKEFEEGIISQLVDESLRKRLSENGKKAVEEKFRLDKVVEEHWKLYKSLM